jgi:hypothetical protein
LARRVSVPGADELFRRTVPAEQVTVVRDVPEDAVPEQGAAAMSGHTGGEPPTARGSSGRVRHDEKMTVYVTADELLDLEHARLTLRRSGLSVDRGRLVREAIAMALADLDAHGEDSALVHRLTQR